MGQAVRLLRCETASRWHLHFRLETARAWVRSLTRPSSLLRRWTSFQMAAYLRHANPPGAATTLSPALARIEQPRPLRARRRKMPALWPTPSRPPPLPAGRALVRRTSGDLAGSPWTSCPLARPCGGNSVPDDARRARSGAPGQRSDQQSAEKSAGPLSALPHAARSAAPSGAALDHLPAASGIRRSLPRSISGIDRRTDIETDGRRIGVRLAVRLEMPVGFEVARHDFGNKSEPPKMTLVKDDAA